ncbi:tripartite motif-containing protein 16-like protein [Acipenser ruthenus]|uniref:tripartite motif-containing protein 16-like protein n=1 Tax=Acipenser ruthenus TaxID=7906 RepID=UPI002741032B|nr:tripartite motif-containing protein 16-like protein [Acipenser ruthenus]
MHLLPFPPEAAGDCPLPCHGNGEHTSGSASLIVPGDEVLRFPGGFATLPRGGCRRGSPFLWDSPLPIASWCGGGICLPSLGLPVGPGRNLLLAAAPLLCSFTQRSACIEIKESEKIFTELIRSIEKIHTEVIELIGANEKAAVNQAEGRMKKLEQEIAELINRNAELQQLSETEDHIHFLQNFQSLCAPPEAGDLPSVTVNTDFSFGAVRKAVSELKDHIEDFCKGELVKITPSSSLQSDSCQLTLDPNTAHRELCLSEGNRKVTLRGETQRYPGDHPERFDGYFQVLCREGLSGTRCYWEIEWSGGEASIGVTYKGIRRKGVDLSCLLGFNDKSWSLICSGSSYSARHNNYQTAITAPHPPRIGVYLDFNAGTLSFYGVSDTMTLLHRFQTVFIEPLYPGFGLHSYGSSVTICQLN